MVAKYYAQIIDGLLESEGGYTNDADDPGGPTNWGITIYDARAYWKPGATADDVRRMPKAVALQIYKSKYWDKMDGDELPAGVDYAVFDFGVNSGIARSAKFLQRIVGASVDGTIGPRTILATKEYVAKYGAPDLINKLCDQRLAYLKQLGIWSTFGRGWSARVARVRKDSLDFANVSGDIKNA